MVEGFEGLFRGVGSAAVEEGEFDVFEGGHAGEEIEGLEDEADAAVADVGEGVAGHAGDIFAGEDIAPRGGAIEAAEDVHEGAFAGAGRAADGDHLALFDGERDAIEGVDDGGGVAGTHDVGFDEVVGRKETAVGVHARSPISGRGRHP